MTEATVRLTMGYFIITISFPEETGKFTGPLGSFPDGGHNPCPHLASRTAVPRTSSLLDFLNFLALGQEHKSYNTKKNLSVGALFSR